MQIIDNTNIEQTGWTRADKLLLAVIGGVIFLDGLDLSLGRSFTCRRRSFSGSSRHSCSAMAAFYCWEAGPPTSSAAAECSFGGCSP